MAAKDGDILFLPEDLLPDILSHLCVKSLIRFKLVSKYWYGTITDPSFVYYQHLNNNHRDLLLVGDHNSTVIFPDVSSSSSRQPFHVPADQYDRLYGPCNGIFCVKLIHEHSRLLSFALWNPATKEFRRLPCCYPTYHIPITEVGSCHGFGRDPITNDYKLVLIRQFCKYRIKAFPKHALVYSLATDSWKDLGELEPMQYMFCDGETYTYMNGMYYWRADDRNVILSFDMSKQVFQEIKEPKEEGGAGESSRRLALYNNDSIGLFVIDHQFLLTIWAMDGGNWIRKINIDVASASPSVWFALGILKDGKVILGCKDGCLVLFDPITGQVMDIGGDKIVAHIKSKTIFIYKESLVSITNPSTRRRAGLAVRLEKMLLEI